MANSASLTRALARPSTQLNWANIAPRRTFCPRLTFSAVMVPLIWLDKVVSRSTANSTRMADGSGLPAGASVTPAAAAHSAGRASAIAPR